MRNYAMLGEARLATKAWLGVAAILKARRFKNLVPTLAHLGRYGGREMKRWSYSQIPGGRVAAVAWNRIISRMRLQKRLVDQSNNNAGRMISISVVLGLSNLIIR